MQKKDLSKEIIGFKFFKEEDDYVNLVRIKRIKGDYAITESDNKIKVQDLLDTMIRLEPIGYITVNLVSLVNSKHQDVIVIYTSKETIKKSKDNPFRIADVVYRNMTNELGKDFHYERILVNINHVGDDMVYTALKCDCIINSVVIPYYLDDQIYNLLKFVNKPFRFNDTLRNIKREFKVNSPLLVDIFNDIEFNDMINDQNKIIVVPKEEILQKDGKTIITDNGWNIVEKSIGTKISPIMITPYDESISINKIDDPNLYLKLYLEGLNKVYIVKYNKIRTEVEDIEDDEEREIVKALRGE